MLSLHIWAFLGVVMISGSIVMQGQGTPSPVEDPEQVELPDGAGTALLWPAGPEAVLLVHGAVYDAASWSDQAVVLQDEGYTVLSLEDTSANAVLTGISWLLERQDARGVALIGASAGGSGALRALSEQPNGIAGLILLGATGDVDALGSYPKLFTASEGEGMADRLEQMAHESAGEHNRVEIMPGGAHAQATFDEPEGEQLLDSMLSFLDEDATWSESSLQDGGGAVAVDVVQVRQALGNYPPPI